MFFIILATSSFVLTFLIITPPIKFEFKVELLKDISTLNRVLGYFLSKNIYLKFNISSNYIKE